MGWLGKLVGRRRKSAAEVLRARFVRFRHLIETNNRVLKLIADASEKLGGEYLFDAQYLAELEGALAEAAAAAVYDLAEMSGNRYPALGAALDRVRAAVRASVAPGTAPAELPLVLALDLVGTELSDEVGEKMGRLGELRRRLGLPVPEGFVVTAEACRRLCARPAVAAALGRAKGGEAAALAELPEVVAAADVPSAVQKAIRQALSRFPPGARFAVRSSAVGEDGWLSFAGQHETRLNVPRDEVLEAYRHVVASLFSARARAYREHHRLPEATPAMAVGCLLMVRAAVGGVAYTVDPAAPESDALVVTAARGLGLAVVEGRSPAERLRVARAAPHRVLAREGQEQESMYAAAEAGGVELVPVPERDRRAPAVDDGTLASLAASALRIERHMRCPQDVEWAVDADGALLLLQARPLRLGPEARPRPESLAAARARYQVLLKGRGEVACRGVGSGVVRLVDPDDPAAAFAPGDVLVARHASPRLAAQVAVASAVVTDTGSTAGHLATIAREHRVPTIVDAGVATALLRPGATVTVDADENVVYAGVAAELLRYALLRDPVYDETDEFRALRRLLRFAAPLSLRDPGGPGFAPESCRTYHDIIRFAHERALAELGRTEGLSLDGHGARTLDLDVPLDLVVVDLGDGVAPDAGPRRLLPRDVASRPLALMLEGLLTPGAWATSPADMDLEGLMASATRAGPLTVPGGGAVKRNVAVVARDYVNLNLRVGYHFNVVDSFLGAGAEDSYVFFRFVGGVTEVTRRTRRARLLESILGQRGFATERSGELVVARLQGVPRALCEERLRLIGRLIGFTRQLDIALRDEATVDRLIDSFLAGSCDATLEGTTEDRVMDDSTDVMVLDDEPTVGERLKDFLEKKGMKVETFVDSPAAVARLKEKRFHVVVTDLKMKGPTGLDVLMEVKNRGLATEVIIITGFRTIEAARTAEFVGAYGFLDKPFHLDDLHAMVKKAAKRARRPAGERS